MIRALILRIVSAGVMLLTPVILIWSLVGGLGGPSYPIYHFGVAVCLLSAVSSFVGFLRLDRPI